MFLLAEIFLFFSCSLYQAPSLLLHLVPFDNDEEKYKHVFLKYLEMNHLSNFWSDDEVKKQRWPILNVHEQQHDKLIGWSTVCIHMSPDLILIIKFAFPLVHSLLLCWVNNMSINISVAPLCKRRERVLLFIMGLNKLEQY